jgi:hypothetical protein
MNDTRTYFFETSKDGRLALYICCINPAYVTHHGYYKSRESAIRRKHLEAATEIDTPTSFTIAPRSTAPVLRTFAAAVAGVTR